MRKVSSYSQGMADPALGTAPKTETWKQHRPTHPVLEVVLLPGLKARLCLLRPPSYSDTWESRENKQEGDCQAPSPPKTTIAAPKSWVTSGTRR